MIKVTRWSPDTCGCKIEYVWDETLEGLARTHQFFRVERDCPAHRMKVKGFRVRSRWVDGLWYDAQPMRDYLDAVGAWKNLSYLFERLLLAREELDMLEYPEFKEWASVRVQWQNIILGTELIILQQENPDFPFIMPAPVVFDLSPIVVSGQDAEKLVAQYAVVHGENTRKNWMLGILEASFPEMPKGGEHYVWSFDADRVLHVQLPKGTTRAQRNQMKAAADIQFGPGLVALDG